MCVVSAVSDYYGTTWPSRFPDKPVNQFDEETKRLLKEALEKLDQIDKRLKDIECFDEQKEEFLKQLGVVFNK